MTVEELTARFENTSDDFANAVQTTLKDSPCDAETKATLDEVARQAFYALRETQQAVIEYLNQ